jgi:hypothetical protein
MFAIEKIHDIKITIHTIISRILLTINVFFSFLFILKYKSMDSLRILKTQPKEKNKSKTQDTIKIILIKIFILIPSNIIIKCCLCS